MHVCLFFWVSSRVALVLFHDKTGELSDFYPVARKKGICP